MKPRPSVASQTQPSTITENPRLRHRHAEQLDAPIGLHFVADYARQHGYGTNDLDREIVEALAPPAESAEGVRLHIRLSVKRLSEMRSPDKGRV
jgi:hypothetical protein